MRFDLLDEYSTLVPFGLGVSRNKTFQEPAVPADTSKRGSHMGLLRKLSGALRQMVFRVTGTWSQNAQASFEHQAAAVDDALSVDLPLRVKENSCLPSLLSEGLVRADSRPGASC